MSFSIKPYVNINVDESIVAHKLKEQFKGSNVFIPIKDDGVDLVLIKPKNPTKAIRIQVKGSKYHYDPKKGITDSTARGWVTMSKEKLEKYCKLVDYIIFIVHKIEINKKNAQYFNPYFIVIPPTRLLELAKKYKKVNGKGDYNFYFTKNGDGVIDNRNENYDLSEYHNNWEIIK